MTIPATTIKLTCTQCNFQFPLFVLIETGKQVVKNCPKCKINLISVEFQEIAGYIYILSNPANLDIFKVGQTCRSVDERVRELSQPTGVPSPFIIEAFFPSFNLELDEKAIHDALGAYRYSPQREFFKTTFNTIYLSCRVQIGYDCIYVNSIIDDYKTYDPWITLRQKVSVQNILDQHIQPNSSTVIEKCRNAVIVSKSFHCPQCKQKMRPVKAILAAKGAFRGCTDCGILVSKLGIEFYP